MMRVSRSDAGREDRRVERRTARERRARGGRFRQTSLSSVIGRSRTRLPHAL